MNNQPAFPVFHQNEITGHIPPETSGMTLRDYFAAKSLQGLLSADEVFEVDDGESMAAEYARVSYEYADAMMEARK